MMHRYAALIPPRAEELPRSRDAAENFLLRSAVLSKAGARSYQYLPFGWRIKRRLETLFAVSAEKRDYNGIQLPSFNKSGPNVDPKYEPFLCRIESKHLKNAALTARSEEGMARLMALWPPDHGLRLWAISREWRADGGSGGYCRSIEYENLVAYRTGATPTGAILEEQIELAEEVLHALRLDFAWDRPACNVDGSYEARNIVVMLDDGQPFRIGQFCDFSAAQKVRSELVRQPGDNSACISLSVNRILYALGSALAQNPQACWPQALAPFDVHIVLASAKPSNETMLIAMQVADRLAIRGRSCMIDDRPISAGRKLFDSDALRLPVRVVLGARPTAGLRIEGAAEQFVPRNEIVSHILATFGEFIHEGN